MIFGVYKLLQSAHLFMIYNKVRQNCAKYDNEMFFFFPQLTLIKISIVRQLIPLEKHSTESHQLPPSNIKFMTRALSPFNGHRISKHKYIEATPKKGGSERQKHKQQTE